MEVGAQSRRCACGTGSRLGSAGAVLLACRIDVEGTVLLDDPLVIGEFHRGILRVLDNYLKAATCLEGQGNCRRTTDLLLRVDSQVLEADHRGSAGWWCGQLCRKRAIRLQGYGYSPCRDRLRRGRTGSRATRSRAQRVIVRVRVVAKDTGSSHSQQARYVAGVAIRIGRRLRRQSRRRTDGDRRGDRGIAVDIVGERTSATSVGRGLRVGESTVGVERE